MYLKHLPDEINKFIQGVKEGVKGAPRRIAKNLVLVREYSAPMSVLRTIEDYYKVIAQVVFFVKIPRRAKVAYDDGYHYIEFALRAQRGARMFFLQRYMIFFRSEIKPTEMGAMDVYDIYEQSEDILRMFKWETDADMQRFLVAVDDALRGMEQSLQAVEQVDFNALAEHLARWLTNTYPQHYPQGVDYNTHITYNGGALIYRDTFYPDGHNDIAIDQWYPYKMQVQLLLRPKGIVAQDNPYFIAVRAQLSVHASGEIAGDITLSNCLVRTSTYDTISTEIPPNALRERLIRAVKDFVTTKLEALWNAARKETERAQQTINNNSVVAAVGATLAQAHAQLWTQLLGKYVSNIAYCYSEVSKDAENTTRQRIHNAVCTVLDVALSVMLHTALTGYVRAELALPRLLVRLTVATKIQNPSECIILACTVDLVYDTAHTVINLDYGSDVQRAPIVRTKDDVIEFANGLCASYTNFLLHNPNIISRMLNAIIYRVHQVSGSE